MKNVVSNDYSTNYYASIKGIWLYVDYINNRLKIIDHANFSEDIINKIIDFAIDKNVGKVISFCKKEYVQMFKDCGFILEGYAVAFYKGTTANCMSFFTDIDRGISKQEKIAKLILEESLMNRRKYSPKDTFDFTIRIACEEDIPQMIKLFDAVFETYPSPVNSAEYLRVAMKHRVLFKVAVIGGKIIGIASADMDFDNLNAEITDCATYPDYRGRGILPKLLISLEKDLISRNFITLYSLSRAINKGINKTLSKLGYEYGGRMINNCHICGSYEDMNIWTKILNE